jgi:thiosulfate dehydrogenase (quinone) large subunit
MADSAEKYRTGLQNPKWVQTLFNDTRFAWLWLAVRLWMGYEWVTAGWEKISGAESNWMTTGESLKGFWTRAIAIPDAPARPAIAFGWYRTFLTALLDSGSYVWFAKLVAVGELLIGVALILGIFVGFAAFMGGFMNWNFIMAGSASTNGLLLVLAVFVVAAWKIAGYIGLNRWVLPYIGAPGVPGKIFGKKKTT